MEELKKIVLNQETEEDRVTSLSVRPERLADFIGQKDLVANIRVAIEAAKQRKEPLEHMLFSGPPGLGKTSLAHIIAHEMQSRLTYTSGPAIQRAGDFIGILTNLEQGDILFIDEIHRLAKSVEEFLYPAMESFKIDFIVDKGPYAKTINFNLKPFTLIGATTRSGLLASPLRDRFGILHHMDFYEPEDLSTIIIIAAAKLGVSVEMDAALEIARRSRGTPRISIRLLKRVRDFAQLAAGPGRPAHIELPVVLTAMDRLKVDAEGMDEFARKTMRVILDTYQGGPVGIEALAATLNEEVDTIADVVEPYLLKAGFLRRTSRGRELTDRARRHLGVSG
ncbi:MAG: Holliday junction branch migration DNA helicase RuvB [Candidatus Omnitrophica bacterium]|nr:Holliday junction branch migration DNA helicase RuvB [Candidatus Omnitrophota bacterium]